MLEVDIHILRLILWIIHLFLHGGPVKDVELGDKLSRVRVIAMTAGITPCEVPRVGIVDSMHTVFEVLVILWVLIKRIYVFFILG